MRLRLDEGWELSRGDEGEWIPAQVPGTVAGALAAAGRWRPGEPDDFDEHDWTFRLRFDAAPDGTRALLVLGGVATHADVALNGTPVATTTSMFLAVGADVGALLRPEGNELTITCRALASLLKAPRRPRARWRTRLADNALRWHRTMLLGRTPGIAPSPAAVGPWRPVWLDRRDNPPRVHLRPRLEGEDGVLAVDSDRPVEVTVGDLTATIEGRGELRLPGVARWWPHTHGEPVLHDVRVAAGGEELHRRVGFRSLASPGDPLVDGLDLVINDVPVFARGAVWTPVDPIGLAPDEERLRAALEQVRAAGLNMVRVVGTATYEQPAFYDLCDELGILVWQDFMFANLDYPIADADFRREVLSEADALLQGIGHRPSLAVLCGNSEVEQQVTMLGLDPELGRGELFGWLLPNLAEEWAPEVPYVPSAPSGGALPIRPDAGVAHWFGVGGYRRPLADARAAGVRFAAECLAFSNVGDADGIDAWVPGDHGAEWDFGDVREHYRAEIYGAVPADPARRLELGRHATGEAMAEVLGEWRRAGSPCRGAIVLWLRDLAPGAGWGLIDSAGRPKAALGPVARVLAPLAVWTTDEGMSGIAVHVANDGPDLVAARLRVALYRDGEMLVGEGGEELELGPHAALTRDAEGVVGRFADVSWAYRFGPPAQDTVVATLEDPAGAILSQAFRFPVGRAVEPCSAADLGLAVDRDGTRVQLAARRVVHGVRLAGAGAAGDDAFCLEPGHPRLVTVADAGAPLTVTALNLDRPVTV